ncbi:MAG: response regulator transcription factor [Microthrixaceae bacterium]
MSSYRIVIADDSADLRLLLTLALRGDADFEVVGEATNGAEAVALAGRLRPDLLLLDLSMPVMDGLEALPLIRDISPSTSVVVVSGFLNGDMQQRVLDLGASGFIEKGDDLGQLVGFVQRLREDSTLA